MQPASSRYNDVAADGVSLDFDCASGRIDAPLKTDKEGRFDLFGTYTRESPGPIRNGHEPKAQPTRYPPQVQNFYALAGDTVFDIALPRLLESAGSPAPAFDAPQAFMPAHLQ